MRELQLLICVRVSRKIVIILPEALGPLNPCPSFTDNAALLHEVPAAVQLQQQGAFNSAQQQPGQQGVLHDASGQQPPPQHAPQKQQHFPQQQLLPQHQQQQQQSVASEASTATLQVILRPA